VVDETLLVGPFFTAVCQIFDLHPESASLSCLPSKTDLPRV
jgi:hypothetical protein